MPSAIDREHCHLSYLLIKNMLSDRVKTKKHMRNIYICNGNNKKKHRQAETNKRACSFSSIIATDERAHGYTVFFCDWIIRRTGQWESYPFALAFCIYCISLRDMQHLVCIVDMGKYFIQAAVSLIDSWLVFIFWLFYIMLICKAARRSKASIKPMIIKPTT